MIRVASAVSAAREDGMDKYQAQARYSAGDDAPEVVDWLRAHLPDWLVFWDRVREVRAAELSSAPVMPL